ELAKKANTTYMNVSLALKSDKTYVDNQLALKANQTTTFTKTEVYTALGLKANQTTTYAITQVDNILAQKQQTITSSTNLVINKLTTISWEPPAGFTDVQIKKQIRFILEYSMVDTYVSIRQDLESGIC
ncbi:MAG: hypothetical protein ACKPKO_25960, partial [Candidatus Fonsibacter sp.]